jgi:hypothetical protein
MANLVSLTSLLMLVISSVMGGCNDASLVISFSFPRISTISLSAAATLSASAAYLSASAAYLSASAFAAATLSASTFAATALSTSTYPMKVPRRAYIPFTRFTIASSLVLITSVSAVLYLSAFLRAAMARSALSAFKISTWLKWFSKEWSSSPACRGGCWHCRRKLYQVSRNCDWLCARFEFLASHIKIVCLMLLIPALESTNYLDAAGGG